MALILMIQMLLLPFSGAIAERVWAAEPLSLEVAVRTALSNNPELAAARARSDAEHAAIRARYSPDKPKFGLMREKNMTLMEQTMGPMNSWALSQEILFPTKYFLMGSAQKSRAAMADQSAFNKQLEIREKAISSFYNVYASDRIIALFEAQKVTLREVARTAEARYSAGSVSQQDQMKAHVEQAKVENELLMAVQERESMAAMLNAVLNREMDSVVLLPEADLPVPELTANMDSILKELSSTSKEVREATFAVDEASTELSLAGWDYAPDFMFSYRKPLTSAPDDAYSVSLDVTIPFWFFLKQTSERAASSARVVEAEKNLEQTIRRTGSEAKALFAKVSSDWKLLKIYQSSLIPLVTNTLNSSSAAYRAGKTSFIELLDSERTLYETKIGYYRTLARYVEELSSLERVVGRAISSLPMGEIK